VISATTQDPLTYTAQGTYTVTWTYDDGHGNTATQNQTVVVDDVTAPVMTLNPTALYLWSPNHQYETITVSQMISSVVDNCGTSSSTPLLMITHVTSDEPEDAAGSGDGNTFGREIQSKVSSLMPAGSHAVEFDASGLQGERGGGD
jgi:hypothetical protein